MVRRIFKAGNSLVISLPKEAIKRLGLQEGSEVSVAVDVTQHVTVGRPALSDMADWFRQHTIRSNISESDSL